MDEIEIWKDISGYEGYYQVSNFGRVKRLPRHKASDKRETHNNIRKPKLEPSGYLSVNLSKDNKARTYLIHRLVALAFIPNPNNLPQVNHKSEIKTENFVENLEWCDQRYNNCYGTARERQRATRANNPNDPLVRKLVGEKNSKSVKCFTPSGVLLAVYKSITEASEKTGVHISTIVRHCKGMVGNEIKRPIRKYRFEYA